MVVQKAGLYLPYAFEIFMFSILICIPAMFLGKTADHIFPKFDQKKTSLIMWAEILIQVSLIAVCTYLIREFITWVTSSFAPHFGNPMKYAIIIMAPIVFFQQGNLYNKMSEIMGRYFNYQRKFITFSQN